MFEGAVTWLPCSFNFNASYASLFAMNLISGLKNDKITFFQTKYVSQALSQTLQTTKMNFENLGNKFSKTTIAIRFNLL